MADRVRSMSLVGESYFLAGKLFYKSKVPQTLSQRLGPKIAPDYVALGTNSSWIAVFKVRSKSGRDITYEYAYSPNFGENYASLKATIDKGAKGPVKFISLGPKGRYFARIDKPIWAVSKALAERLGRPDDYTAIWFGMGDSLVAAQKSGKLIVDLEKESYPGLKEKIESGGPPQVLAINLTNEKDWVGVWPNGSYMLRNRSSCLPTADANVFFEKTGFKAKEAESKAGKN